MKSDESSAVVVKNLYKSFRLPHEQHSGLKQAIVDLTNRNRKKGYETQRVLDNVSFEIKKGEFFGIVGRNGSGKSTLLKLLAGIYTPDSGEIKVNGTLVPFIELGVGFNPELTGRENVFLNGALLGFSRREMEAMYDDVVKFAELEKFMDQKLKNYSSGMQVRLAFSIAIRANGDILLLDEVLAVGDEAFQRKCFSYFDKLKREKKTVVLVTHDMGAVQRFCTKAIFIKDGKVSNVGKPDKIASLYNQQNDEMYAKSLEVKEEVKPAKVKSRLKLVIKNGRGSRAKRFYTGDEMIIEAEWPQDNVSHIGIALMNSAGLDIFSPNTYKEKQKPLTRKSITYKVRLNLAQGDYHIKAALFGKHDKDIIDRLYAGPQIIVESRPESIQTYVGITELDHTWVE